MKFKDFYIVTKSISNKYCSFESHQRVLKKRIKAAELSLTLIIIKNHNIKMISEGSCDTEDWKFNLNCILKYIQT